MKGFRDTSKMRSGHHFPARAGFSSSSGKTQEVRGYTRRVPKYAEGGSVDSSVIRRTEPMTQFDAEYGGTGPLRPGFKKGGKIGPVKKGALHKALGVKQSSPLSMATLESAKKSDSPLMRKRANFAINARKWNKYADGGPVKGLGAQATDTEKRKLAGMKAVEDYEGKDPKKVAARDRAVANREYWEGVAKKQPLPAKAKYAGFKREPLIGN